MNHSLRRYHLAGIGGAGMSGLARILLDQGASVSGTDTKDSAAIRTLRDRGAQIALVQDGSAIPGDVDVVVASLAIDEDNAELAAARTRGIEIVRYPEALARLMAQRRGLCVAGAHGKTTVTAALAYCLQAAGMEPSFIVGGHVPQLGVNARFGRGEWFVAEACEYQRAFLAYRPEVAVITNVEAEHLDYYRDEADVVDAFGSFAAQVSGLLLVCAQSPRALDAAGRAACPVQTYAVGAEADWVATPVESDRGPSFHLDHRGDHLGRFDIALPGRHNVANAAGVVAATQAAGLSVDAVRGALAEFRGAERRFEVRGECRGVTIVDDFAHHPTEIRALLATAREMFPGRRLVCVFQPHQYSRTRAFFDEFADALAAAEWTVVAPIYEARDTDEDRRAVSEAGLAHRIATCGGKAEALPSFDEIERRLEAELKQGDVLLTVGAGDVWKIATAMVRRLGGVRQV